MTGDGPDTWTGDEAYESFMGRWSRVLAPRFLAWFPGVPGSTWCDVGCGTGALAHAVLATEQPTAVLGVDTSQPFLAAAARHTALATELGSATAIPADDGRFGHVVAGLLLNFVPEPEAALVEMRRVCVPGGLVGAYVWDYAEGMALLRRFWDAAAAVDPAARLLDEGARFPICRPHALRTRFEAAGLTDVAVTAIEIPMVFPGFDDLWRPFLGGQGPAPGYCAGLPDDVRAAVRDRLRATLPTGPGGEIALTARAWAGYGIRAAGR